MSRRFEGLEPHRSQLDAIPVAKRDERVLRLGRGAKIDCRAGAVAQLQMACHEVRMKVCEDDVLNREPVLLGEGQVLIRIALRIDDNRRFGVLVADQV
jgi:hypothetical protein